MYMYILSLVEQFYKTQQIPCLRILRHGRADIMFCMKTEGYPAAKILLDIDSNGGES